MKLIAVESSSSSKERRTIMECHIAVTVAKNCLRIDMADQSKTTRFKADPWHTFVIGFFVGLLTMPTLTYLAVHYGN